MLPVVEALAAAASGSRSTPATPRSPEAAVGRRRDARQRRRLVARRGGGRRTASAGSRCTRRASPARCRTTRATTTSSPRCATTWSSGPRPARGRRRPRGLDRPGHRLRQDAARTTSPCWPTSTSWSPPAGRCSSARAARGSSGALLGRVRRRGGPGADRRPPRRLAGHRHVGDGLRGRHGAGPRRPADGARGAGGRRRRSSSRGEGARTVPMKGKWAQGIQPRNFAWVMKDRLAVCERPGGYGANHRRVRRQEEIIWIREQGFTCVVSLIPSPHNLHNYAELGVTWRHRPFGAPRRRPTPLPARRCSPSCASCSPTASKVLLHRRGARRPHLRAHGRLHRVDRHGARRARGHLAGRAARAPPDRPDRPRARVGGRHRRPTEAERARPRSSCAACASRASAACCPRSASAQPLEVDLDVALDLAAAGRSDDLARHGRLRRGVRRSSSGSATAAGSPLLEALAERHRRGGAGATDGSHRGGHGGRAQAAPAGAAAAGHVGRAHHPDRAPGAAVTRAFLGLGSNLGDRARLLRRAPSTTLDRRRSAVSPVYETDPVGGPDAGRRT